MESKAHRKLIPVGLVLAVLIYIGLRAAILVTAFDHVCLPNYELFPMGTLPKILSLGGGWPLYLFYDNAGGQLLTGCLAGIPYALFGDNYLALKLVPATLGLAAIVPIWALAARLWGRRAAAVAALLFALGPSELATKYSLFASGNHFENLFFTSLALYTHYGLQRAPAERRGRWLAAAGFTAGLALFVFLGAIIPVGLAVLAHLGARGWRGALRDVRYWLAPFVVGSSPLLVLNLFTAGRGGGFLLSKFDDGDRSALGSVVERMQSFITADVFEAGFHGAWGPLDWRLPSIVLLACMGIAWLAALPTAVGGLMEGLRGVCCWDRTPEVQARAARKLELVPLVFLAPVSMLAFGLSDLRIDRWPEPLGVAGFRYFLPTFLMGSLLVAALVGRARTPRVGALALGIAFLAGATGLWNLRYLDWSPAEPTLGLHYRGSNFVQAARALLSNRNDLGTAERVRYADRLPAFYRGQVYRGLGFQGAQKLLLENLKRKNLEQLFRRIATEPLDLEALVAGYPEEMHVHLARGAGEGVRNLAGQWPRSPLALAAQMKRLLCGGHPLAPLVVEGMAVSFDYPRSLFHMPCLLARNVRLLATTPPIARPHFVRGMGRQCGQLLARCIPSEEWLLFRYAYELELTSPLEECFYEGLAQGLAGACERPTWTPAADRIVAADQRPAARAVFEAALRR